MPYCPQCAKLERSVNNLTELLEEAQKPAEAVTRLLDLLSPYIVAKERIIINDDPQLEELIATFRLIRPK